MIQHFAPEPVAFRFRSFPRFKPRMRSNEITNSFKVTPPNGLGDVVVRDIADF